MKESAVAFKYYFLCGGNFNSKLPSKSLLHGNNAIKSSLDLLSSSFSVALPKAAADASMA